MMRFLPKGRNDKPIANSRFCISYFKKLPTATESCLLNPRYLLNFSDHIIGDLICFGL